jgi:hypothetical protein
VVSAARGQPEVAGVGGVGEWLGPLPAERGPADLAAERQQPGGDVVGVDLVAGQEQLLRPGFRVGVGGLQDLVEGGQGVAALAVRLAAGPVDEPDLLQPLGREDEAGQVPGPVAELVGQAERPEVVGGRAVVAGVVAFAVEPQVVAVHRAGGERRRRPGGDHRDMQEPAQGDGAALPGVDQGVRAGLGPPVDGQLDRPRVPAGHEHAHGARFDPARHRPGQHQRPAGGWPGAGRWGVHGDGDRGSAGAAGTTLAAGAARRCCCQRQPR